jgi:Mg2+/Co2+ transporter CorB
MVQLAIAVIILLIGSAVCSGAETALLSVPALKARQLAQSNHPRAKALLAIRQRINRPIATIVILNNLFNIMGSSIIGSVATKVFGDALLGVFSGVLTFLVIVFAEILPKTLAERYAEPIALMVAIPVRGADLAADPAGVGVRAHHRPLCARSPKPHHQRNGDQAAGLHWLPGRHYRGGTRRK